MGQGHIGVAVKLSATMIRRGYLLETVRLFGSVAVEACRRVKHGRPGEQLVWKPVVTVSLCRLTLRIYTSDALTVSL